MDGIAVPIGFPAVTTHSWSFATKIRLPGLIATQALLAGIDGQIG
jgi:hypothetical protein